MSESLDIMIQPMELVDYIGLDMCNSKVFAECKSKNIPIFDVIALVVVYCFDCWDYLDDISGADLDNDVHFLVEGLASEIIPSIAKYLHGLTGLWIDSWEGDFDFEQEASDDAFFNIHVDAVTMHNSNRRYSVEALSDSDYGYR